MLLEWARRCYLALSGLAAVSQKKTRFFINIVSGRAFGFHRQAKLFDLNFSSEEKLLIGDVKPGGQNHPPGSTL